MDMKGLKAYMKKNGGDKAKKMVGKAMKKSKMGGKKR